MLPPIASYKTYYPLIRRAFGVLMVAWVLGLPACKPVTVPPSDTQSKSIVILYENDVHCNIDGYSKLRGLKDAILAADTAHVATVSCGDFLQGAIPGAYSDGAFIVELMQDVGYDAVTIGNHEFDYGMARMLELVPQIGSPVVVANLYAEGADKPLFSPYIIKSFGDKRVAFVGVTTPDAMHSEAYAFYDEQQQPVYTLRTNDVYTLVQSAVDQARAEGADYVIVLSHLGEAELHTGVNSHTMIAVTTGIDAVLDGHTHSVVPCEYVANKDGVPVPVTQTGTQFANYGHLWISTDGTISLGLIADADNPFYNTEVSAHVDSIYRVLEDATSYKVADLAFDIPNKGADGMWLVRCQEAAIGNLVADAFRAEMDADIGLVNGGGVRSGLYAGEVTYGDMYNLLPFDNMLYRVRATGQQLMDMLTQCTAKCPRQDGSFPQVSGIRFTVHTTSDAVTDVAVYDKQYKDYRPLDINGTYTVAVTDYYASGGFYRTLQDCSAEVASGLTGRDALTKYIMLTLEGHIPDDYRAPQGRINLLED